MNFIQYDIHNRRGRWIVTPIRPTRLGSPGMPGAAIHARAYAYRLRTGRWPGRVADVR